MAKQLENVSLAIFVGCHVRADVVRTSRTNVTGTHAKRNARGARDSDKVCACPESSGYREIHSSRHYVAPLLLVFKFCPKGLCCAVGEFRNIGFPRVIF